MSVEDPYLAQLEASREPDERLGEAWISLYARCAFAAETDHPEETDVVIEDVAFFDTALLNHRGWVEIADGWICPACVKRNGPL